MPILALDPKSIGEGSATSVYAALSPNIHGKCSLVNVKDSEGNADNNPKPIPDQCSLIAKLTHIRYFLTQ